MTPHLDGLPRRPSSVERATTVMTGAVSSTTARALAYKLDAAGLLVDPRPDGPQDMISPPSDRILALLAQIEENTRPS